MRYAIQHTTAYRFGSAVFLEPHIFRFHPRSDPSQGVEFFSLDISPVPSGISHGIDLSGNLFATAWFSDTTAHLTMTARSVVTTLRTNAFDYIVLPEGLRPLPWSIGDPAAAGFLRRRRIRGDDPVATFAAKIATEATSIGPFLTSLNDELHRMVGVIVRVDGEPRAAAETLATRTGSCRDLAVLFADACRSVGVPARFVSGYQEGDPEQDVRYLHAWTEAWIPGAGWRGYDPTLGLTVADRHIAVAAAADSRDAAPTVGNFRGSPPSVEMNFQLDVTPISEAEERLPKGSQLNL